jgi:hypothetical protein
MCSTPTVTNEQASMPAHRSTGCILLTAESLEVHAAHDFLFPPKIMSVLQLQLTNCFHKQLMHEPLVSVWRCEIHYFYQFHCSSSKQPLQLERQLHLSAKNNGRHWWWPPHFRFPSWSVCFGGIIFSVCQHFPPTSTTPEVLDWGGE